MSRSGARRARGGVRPTAARVRTALFDRLGALVEGAAALDLFAGTGALGIEALRRGAGRVVFVERDAALCRTLRTTLQRNGMDDHAEVWCGDVLAAISRLGLAGAAFDLVLLDPPYGQDWIARTLAALRRARIVRPGGLIVAEGHWRDRPALDEGFTLVAEARYGQTALWYIRTDST
jgi:16S rRNA (guanine(966)-N(2))-methyltransferase RsmD